MPEERVPLVACGILRKELQRLIQENDWPIAPTFLDSTLHVDFGALSQALRSALAPVERRGAVVFYGCCHPLMDDILEANGAQRTAGQNCLEMLLGRELFSSELAAGAFFLLEEWAKRWDSLSRKTFGDNPEVVRQVFLQGDRKYLLCVRTPCSEDFTAEAEAAGEAVGLPVRWLDVSLGHLASVLAAALSRRHQGQACPA